MRIHCSGSENNELVRIHVLVVIIASGSENSGPRRSLAPLARAMGFVLSSWIPVDRHDS